MKKKNPLLKVSMSELLTMRRTIESILDDGEGNACTIIMLVANNAEIARRIYSERNQCAG